MRIPFAYRVADGRYVDASMVPSGRACGCICPGCLEAVLAKHKKTSNRASHFSHESGSVCAGALETALHKAAKQAICEAEGVYFPLLDSGLKGIVRFTEAHAEKEYGDFIPDVLILEKNRTWIGVEVLVTHGIDLEKENKIRKAELTVIEIDLSKTPRFISYADLQSLIQEGRYRSRIVYNHAAEVEMRRIQAEQNRKEDAARRAKWSELMPWIN